MSLGVSAKVKPFEISANSNSGAKVLTQSARFPHTKEKRPAGGERA